MSETFKLEFSRYANNEAKSIIKYYRRVANDEIADRFKQELNGAVSKIVDSPRRWTIYKDNYRYIQVEEFPYIIFYRIDDQKKLVRVIAVAHEKRAPGYWLDRK